MINGFTIFGVKIYFYALIIITGALLGAFIATKEAKRRGFDPEIIWDFLPWVLMAGIIGARIWHVLTPDSTLLIDGKNPYFLFPLKILNFRQGGLGIPGAVMAGVLALWIYTKRKKLNFMTWLDIAAPGLALGQAVGRWGNFFNQEVYGMPSTLPWAIKIDPAHRLPGFEQFERYHPTFLYESIWNLLNMGVLLLVARKFKDRLKPGDVFFIYMIIYAFGRFMLEFIRIVYSPIAGINSNQALMGVVFVVSLAALLIRHKQTQKADKDLA